MAYVFYKKEREYNADLYALEISAKQAQKLANKLSRHFKFGRVTVVPTKGKRGYAPSWLSEIWLPKITTVGTTIHECAHVANRKKYRSKRHTKKLHTTIKRFSNYFRKHLKEQFAHLEVPKAKPKPTLIEKHEKALARTEKSIKRLQTKIKTLKTRLRTAKKKRTKHKRRLRELAKLTKTKPSSLLGDTS